ncbi:MAG: hemerythrin domain-containing protein [Gammaproteobacteria bacterium]|jgi:hemerythrin-like domain-containing protein|nr:hemerythrin domain-containing protein [Gammaproteobacteria bacterium]MBT4450589.1 hemerythrin domain-containing protein [Gammaproteobacteria bacterium]MBT6457169.1 hemerythrin domain-containing protein [Gammaproteobacteria bacterium]
MLRIKQLQPLSMEHHLSLSLAARAIKTANTGEQNEIKLLCEKIINDYTVVWRKHFDNEEQTIFIPYSNRSPEIDQLCKQLTQEHQQFDTFIEQMKSGNTDVLLEFGTLLKTHTRLEERELFPKISEVLSTKELDEIYKEITSPD